MEQTNCKSKFSRSPFRATQLWNEAVSILQSGMPTRRHFHRMRYYDNCFSGKEAVEWLSRTLTSNPRFGKNVTNEGTRKLLQHFLKAGVFQSVKGTLTFKDSGLFEFVDQTINSPSCKQDRKHILSKVGLTEVDPNIPAELRGHSWHGEKRRNSSPHRSPDTCEETPRRAPRRGQLSPNKLLSWKDFILQRIQNLLPFLNVELMVDPEAIHPEWVMHNVCSEFDNLRKKTELPFWVFTAITSVIRSPEESEYTTYSGFEKDVYSVVRDYLRHRSSPLVPYNLYELVLYTFSSLHSLDLESKGRSQARCSVESLMLSMSHDWNNVLHTEDLSRTVLPPNSCFETAFTSDEPVTRIVPQSSVDTICLSKSTKAASLVSSNMNSQRNILKSYKELRDIALEENSRPTNGTLSGKCKHLKKASHLRRTQSMMGIDRGAKLTVSKQQSYINYGLSQSLDDLLLEDESVGLDLEIAMRSVHCLLQASTSPENSRSAHSSVESVSTVNSCPQTTATLVCVDSCLWYESIQETARQVFQSVFMLMSPSSRTSLCMLLQFIDKLPVPSHSTITKTEMVYDLSAHILSPGPRNKNVYSHHMVLSVVYFLVDNVHFIFNNLPDAELMQNKQENKAVQGRTVFCEQLTRHQFEDQGVTSSWLALAELLDQIINDKKMKGKEKKKRLKKFKDAYPHIYRQRFGGSSSNLASLVHLR